MDFLNHGEGGYVFPSGFTSFSFILQCTLTGTLETVRGCESLKK
jgi:hypothetical protein